MRNGKAGLRRLGGKVVFAAAQSTPCPERYVCKAVMRHEAVTSTDHNASACATVRCRFVSHTTYEGVATPYRNLSVSSDILCCSSEPYGFQHFHRLDADSRHGMQRYIQCYTQFGRRSVSIHMQEHIDLSSPLIRANPIPRPAASPPPPPPKRSPGRDCPARPDSLDAEERHTLPRLRHSALQQPIILGVPFILHRLLAPIPGIGLFLHGALPPRTPGR